MAAQPLLPISLQLQGKTCLVVGGGAVAETRVRTLLACRGLVRLVSPQVTPWLAHLAQEGAIAWQQERRAATAAVHTRDDLPNGDAALAVEPVEVLPAPVLVSAPGIHEPGETVDAHLDYLSRLSTRAQTTGTVAPVVSLAEFVAARGKPFGSSTRSRESAT